MLKNGHGNGFFSNLFGSKPTPEKKRTKPIPRILAPVRKHQEPRRSSKKQRSSRPQTAELRSSARATRPKHQQRISRSRSPGQERPVHRIGRKSLTTGSTNLPRKSIKTVPTAAKGRKSLHPGQQTFLPDTANIGFGTASTESKDIVRTTSGKEAYLLDFAEDEEEAVGILQDMKTGNLTLRPVDSFDIVCEDEESDSELSDFEFPLEKMKSIKCMPRPSTNYVLPRGTTGHNKAIVTNIPMVRTKTVRNHDWKTEATFWTKQNLDLVHESRLRPLPSLDPEPSPTVETSSTVDVASVVPAGTKPQHMKSKYVDAFVYHWKEKHVMKWAYVYENHSSFVADITLDFSGSKGVVFSTRNPGTKIQGLQATFTVEPMSKTVGVEVRAEGAFSLGLSAKKKYRSAENPSAAGDAQGLECYNEAIEIRLEKLKSSGAPQGKSIIHWLHDVGMRFIDLEFPPTPKSIFETNHAERECLIFRRACDTGASHVFVDGIRFEDVCQGKLGDCWLMSSVAALTDHPDLVDNLFLTQKVNDAAVFQTKICVAGMWETFTLDEYFPCMPNGNFYYTKATTGALWAPLLEKTFAKYYGSYERIESHDPSVALVALTGKPVARWQFQEADANEMWNVIKNGLKKDDDLVTISTVNDSRVLKDTGLVVNHAYTIIDAKKGLGKRLVCIRNPWGKQEWTGAWSDTSKNWSTKYKQFFRPNLNPEDGIFWMDFKDLRKFFESLTVCFCEPETKVTRMPMKCGVSNSTGAISFYSINLNIPKNGSVEWIGLHQIDANRQGAPDYNPLVLIAFKKDGKTLTPYKSAVCHNSFYFEQMKLEAGEYELFVFHCGRVLEACPDAHTSTLTIHGRGQRFQVSADLEHNAALLEDRLCRFTKLGEMTKYSKDLRLWYYTSSGLTLWSAENKTQEKPHNVAKLQAKLNCRNKVFPYFCQGEDIEELLNPGDWSLLTCCLQKDVTKASNLSRSMQLKWVRGYE